jgi:hypothetical protein
MCCLMSVQDRGTADKEIKLQTEMETGIDIQESERDLQVTLKRRCDGGHQADAK